jgi:phage repressor protein C with HTH and peptisase S24 domain
MYRMTQGERLRQARIEAGFQDGTEAARRFGWTVPTYLSHENGTRGFRADKAQDYARAFKVAPEWLMFGAGEGKRPALPVPAGDVEDELVPVYNVAASAGPGALIDWHEEVVERLAFPPGYLRHITSANPKYLAIISVKGRSMEPTLREDDVVMIDTAKRDLSFEGIFVIRDGGQSMLVKRISRASRRGFVMLVSDNRDHPPVERALDDIEVIGKVIWAGVKM